MTNTETRQAATVHGEVEYEVVECDSCGAEILADEANDFTIGDREGVACDLCVGEGPSDFPHPEEIPVIAAPFVVLAWPLMMPAAFHMIIHSHSPNERDFGLLVLSFAAGAVLWTCIAFWMVGAFDQPETIPLGVNLS